MPIFTIIAYHLNGIMLLRYVICNYIWHIGSQNYELLRQLRELMINHTSCTGLVGQKSVYYLCKQIVLQSPFFDAMCDVSIFTCVCVLDLCITIALKLHAARELGFFSEHWRRSMINGGWHAAWINGCIDDERKRGVDSYKRTVTTHSCSSLKGVRFGHYMSSCLFSFSFIGHILA